MPVKVPFTNAQTCHDSLQKSPALWSAFNVDLLGVANASKPAADRLDDVIGRAKDLWSKAVIEGGVSPREYDGPWRCAVGDLNAALVDAALKEIDVSPASNQDKRALVARVRASAEAAIASPFLLGVQLSLTRAERKYAAAN